MSNSLCNFSLPTSHSCLIVQCTKRRKLHKRALCTFAFCIKCSPVLRNRCCSYFCDVGITTIRCTLLYCRYCFALLKKVRVGTEAKIIVKHKNVVKCIDQLLKRVSDYSCTAVQKQSSLLTVELKRSKVREVTWLYRFYRRWSERPEFVKLTWLWPLCKNKLIVDDAV